MGGYVSMIDGHIDELPELSDLDKKIIIALADCNMNENAVARKMYMYRNGVVYHLEKVKRLTGLDPMNFYDLSRLLVMIAVCP